VEQWPVLVEFNLNNSCNNISLLGDMVWCNIVTSGFQNANFMMFDFGANNNNNNNTRAQLVQTFLLFFWQSCKNFQFRAVTARQCCHIFQISRGKKN